MSKDYECKWCKGDHDLPESEQSLATRVCYWMNKLEDGWVLQGVVEDLVKLDEEKKNQGKP